MEKHNERVTMRLSKGLHADLEKLRKKEPWPPKFSSFIRWLLWRVVEEEKQKQKAKPKPKAKKKRKSN